MDINELRIALASDFRLYLAYQMEKDGFTADEFQLVFADFLTGGRPNWICRKKCILGFRGSAKTYVLRRYCEWRWQRRPETQIVVHSSNDDLAGQFAESVKRTLVEDPLFRHLRASGGGTFQFSLKGYRPEKGHSMRCAGIKTAITGQRADLYVFDDPEPDVEPEALYSRILAAFEEADFILHPVDRLWRGIEIPVPEQTNYVVIGQPHWTGTAYLPPDDDPGTGEVIGHALRDAMFLKIPALMKVPVGTPGSVASETGGYAEISMMPSRFTTESLIHKRDTRSISPPRWRLQMDIDASPVEGDMSVIPFSRIPRINHGLDKIQSLSCVIDPADSEGACEWGCVAGGMVGNRIHVLDMWGFRAEIMSLEEGELSGMKAWGKIFDYCTEMGVTRLYLEKNMKAAAISAKRAIAEYGAPCQVHEYSSKANKLVRIVTTLESPCHTGMVSFEPHVLMDRMNIKQMTELKRMRLPQPNDRLDALAGLVQVFLEQPHVTGTGKAQAHMGIGQGMRPPTFHRIGDSTLQSPFARLRNR